MVFIQKLENTKKWIILEHKNSIKNIQFFDKEKSMKKFLKFRK